MVVCAWCRFRLLPRGSGFVDYNRVPRGAVNATCEMARELLIADRTLPPAGEGIDTALTQTSTGTAPVVLTSTKTSRKYDKKDTRRIISAVARAMLLKYGSLISGGSG